MFNKIHSKTNIKYKLHDLGELNIGIQTFFNRLTRMYVKYGI